MSGETLEDYFRHLNLDDGRRKYLENIKEGKHVDKELEEHFKNGNREQHSPIAEYSLRSLAKCLTILININSLTICRVEDEGNSPTRMYVYTTWIIIVS